MQGAEKQGCTSMTRAILVDALDVSGVITFARLKISHERKVKSVDVSPTVAPSSAGIRLLKHLHVYPIASASSGEYVLVDDSVDINKNENQPTECLVIHVSISHICIDTTCFIQEIETST
ncbi:hypothetical protein K788_00005465 [Paraburkholderia caribensis MBA4]|uniref:Uncharacterized protein n=2 Tax=Paraburkholderia caribensis TaxID=75105 RepID=A0A0P0RH23_9BURK|nr:hypothetical protein K788_00005465 [Paraburkholderia caribensis MBA4]